MYPRAERRGRASPCFLRGNVTIQIQSSLCGVPFFLYGPEESKESAESKGSKESRESRESRADRVERVGRVEGSRRACRRAESGTDD
jgi:hypothetical protein